MRSVAIIQARMGSTRLPGKVLAPLGRMPVLGWVVRAAQAIPGVDAVVVATGSSAENDPIAAWCASARVAAMRGPDEDVLARYALAAREARADIVLRLTADCPLLDPAVCGQVLHLVASGCADYASNVDPATWPDGLDCEAFTADALFAADRLAGGAPEREHVTPFMRADRARLRNAPLVCPLPGLAAERWTLDTPGDMEFLQGIASRLGAAAPPSFVEVLALLRACPELRRPPSEVRNAGFARSVALAAATVPAGQRSFDRSRALLESAERLIPLGSQTFSKSRVQYPPGAAPLFLTHGSGGRVWDVDGNEYVDLVNGLLAVGLGYRDPDVDAAIRRQLADGISFSLSTELEQRLAAAIVRLVPCAEQVRFAKNGTDATSAAVRIARAATGRDRVITCGYHGWQDWFIGATTRSKGVPAAVRALTHPVPYNDLRAVEDLLAKHRGEFAAMVMEPANIVPPAPGYLGSLKELLHAHGAFLVFDEVITGFRFAKGGAQELFGVVPDLASLGKAMGNGMPISAVVGRADLMRQMEEVFFSATFGGEALSLAAALAVLAKIEREPVVERLWASGARLRAGVDGLLAARGLDGLVKLNGFDPWVLLSIEPHAHATPFETKTILLYELAARGVLTVGSHNVSYAHDEADLAHALGAWAGALDVLATMLRHGPVRPQMKVPPLEPVFRVR
jgi:glutamate-1-semialdehyde 2,1-aminomutase